MPLLFLLPQLSNPPHTFSLHIYILYILTYIPQFIIEISNVYARTRAHHFWNFMILLKRRFKKSANNTNILASTAGTKTRRDLQYREFAALLAAINSYWAVHDSSRDWGKKEGSRLLLFQALRLPFSFAKYPVTSREWKAASFRGFKVSRPRARDLHKENRMSIDCRMNCH